MAKNIFVAEVTFTDFLSKCGQIPQKLLIWSHLLKKSLMGIFIICAELVLPFMWQRGWKNWSFISACDVSACQSMEGQRYWDYLEAYQRPNQMNVRYRISLFGVGCKGLKVEAFLDFIICLLIFFIYLLVMYGVSYLYIYYYYYCFSRFFESLSYNILTCCYT